MSKTNKIVKGTLALTAGRTIAYALSFIRNMLLARLLTKADYGLASVFSLATLLLEISGNMAFGTQTIQSPHGDSEEFQSTAQFLAAIGGVCSAILLLAACYPLAHIFHHPELWWAFALLAVVPLFQSMVHLDNSRFQRHYDYTHVAVCDVAAQLATCVAVWPLTLWLKDFRVILFIMVIRPVVFTSLSFIQAERPYRWGWRTDYAKSMLSFGWPLLLTSIVIFASQQSEQMLVGSLFSLETLAGYALAFSLVSIPYYISVQVFSPVMLSLLSQAQTDHELLITRYRQCVQMSAIASMLCLLPTVVAGEQLISLFYGSKYSGTGLYVALLAVGFSFRFLRFATDATTTAKADTLTNLYCILFRTISIPIILISWLFAKNPLVIPGSAVIAEIAALVAALFRLRKLQNIPMGISLKAAAYTSTLIFTGAIFAFVFGPHLAQWQAIPVAMGGFAISVLAAKFCYPRIFSQLLSNIVEIVAKVLRQKQLKDSPAT